MNKQKVVLSDLDGTLADDTRTKYPDIGPPVPAMLARIKAHIAAGYIVKIFTARMSQKDPAEERDQVERITDWCEVNGLVNLDGTSLPITNRKGLDVTVIYDDRAISVKRNTGRIEDANAPDPFGWIGDLFINGQATIDNDLAESLIERGFATWKVFN